MRRLLRSLKNVEKNDLITIAAHYQISVTTQQLKREIKSAVIQRLVEIKVLVLPVRVEEEALRADVQVPLVGEEEQSGMLW